MSKYIFEGSFKKDKTNIKITLMLIHFQDESNIHFIYSPHLDLSGYGKSKNKAVSSFEIVLDDFIDYTIKKKTLSKVLKELGWVIKGTNKNPKKLKAPSITDVIKENDYVSEIFDTYPTNTFHQEINIPALVQ